jgi:hypothetical protein
LRQPLFYISRVPRVPQLLFTHGFSEILRRLALSAPDRDVYLRPRFSFRKIALRFWSMVKARLSTKDVTKAEATIAGWQKERQSSR